VSSIARSRTAAFAAFQHEDFRRFQLARLLNVVGWQMQTVAVGWQVYALTRDPLQLGYVGLAQFLPSVSLAPLTGDAADRFDRRRLLVISSLLLGAAALALWWLAATPQTSVFGIYAAVMVVGVARSIAGPAGNALMPNLVTAEHFSNAVTWNSSTWQIAAVLGPALGGVIYAWSGGAQAVYACTASCELLALLLFLAISKRSHGQRQGPFWNRLGAGISYVWREKLILGALSLDLFAVLFGGAVALLPIFAGDILHVGPSGLGWLRSAPSFGALIMAVTLAYRPIERNTGKTLLGCVALFGACMVGFGLSTSFVLSLFLLTLAGAADLVSVVMRHTLIQLNTPDDMRGRVSAVSLVFVGASNELGEFESGLAANALGVVPSVVVGGFATLLVVALWTRLFPGLRSVDRLQPTHAQG
jgi:MFS family permease